MITINTVSSTKFSFNGVNYLKNFTPIVVGDKIRILNTYDSKIELTDEPTLFSDFTVDGNTFANVALLQDALLTVIFTRSSLGGIVGSSAFTDLTDTPSAYTGQANKVVSVKADESGLEFTAPSGGSGTERIIFKNRSTWTFPSTTAPFPLISSTNFELSVANLNSGTDVALTALNNITPIFVPIGVAPVDMLLKKVIIEGRQVYGSWQGFDLRCVVGSNRTESVVNAFYSHLDSQVVDEFTYTPPNSGNAFINHTSVSSVVIPANHGVILMLSFNRPSATVSPVLTVQLEFDKV